MTRRNSVNVQTLPVAVERRCDVVPNSRHQAPATNDDPAALERECTAAHAQATEHPPIADVVEPEPRFYGSLGQRERVDLDGVSVAQIDGGETKRGGWLVGGEESIEAHVLAVVQDALQYAERDNRWAQVDAESIDEHTAESRPLARVVARLDEDAAIVPRLVIGCAEQATGGGQRRRRGNKANIVR